MGILRRLISDTLLRRGALAPLEPQRPSRLATTDPTAVSLVHAAQPPMDAIEEARRIAARCECGPAREPARSLAQLIRRWAPPSPDAVQALVHEAVVPALRACVRDLDADAACALETVVYNDLIKRFELPSHYEACLGAMDEPLHQLGVQTLGQSAETLAASDAAQSLLFSFQTLGSSGAHVRLFCNVLNTHIAANPGDAKRFGVIGAIKTKPSAPLRELAARHGLQVHALPMHDSKSAYDATIEVMARGGYDRLVVVAMPIGLSYLSGRLPPSRLAWWSMKFELSCVENLLHRCTLMSAHLPHRRVGNKVWLQAPPMMEFDRTLKPGHPLPQRIADALALGGPIFYTINREEKIKHPTFLAMVSRVLLQVPGSRFLWTGQEELPEVVSHFERSGLGLRQHFVGWVEPDDLLAHGNVFLDTPVLSGTVAARAAVLGKPVVTLADSRSWISVFLPAYAIQRGTELTMTVDEAIGRLEALALRLEARDSDEYVATAVRLATDVEAKRTYAEAIGAFACHYFLSNDEATRRHFANLSLPLSAVLAAGSAQ
jgi:hypothetical protein